MERGQSSRLRVEPGLYVLRYVSSASSAPPRLSARASADGHIEFLGDPALPHATLTSPGQGLALSASQPTTLDLEVAPSVDGGSVDAQVELERLGAGVQKKDDAPRAPVSASDFDLAPMCHVARRGDVRVAAGEWIAGPQSPSPIEGVLLATGAGAEHGVEVQALIAGEKNWTPWAPGGVFVGTKGRATPLVGLRVRLTDAAPAAIELDGSALFLGAPVSARTGRSLEFVSPSSMDPMVGFKIAARYSAAPRVAGPQQESQQDAIAPVRRGRVRVFRANSEARVGDLVRGKSW